MASNPSTHVWLRLPFPRASLFPVTDGLARELGPHQVLRIFLRLILRAGHGVILVALLDSSERSLL